MLRFSILCPMLAAVLIALAGCGATQSVAVMSDAEAQLTAARAAGAQARAPYEYRAAEVYLAQAHEEAGQAEYEWATELARRALDLALQARERARTGAVSDKAPPIPKGPDDP